ncbi:hypothetical protein GKODMF_05875 [Candidatus Electrothrix gigas]
MTGQAQSNPQDAPQFLSIKGAQILSRAMLKLFAVKSDKGIKRYSSLLLQSIKALPYWIKCPFAVFLDHRPLTKPHCFGRGMTVLAGSSLGLRRVGINRCHSKTVKATFNIALLIDQSDNILTTRCNNHHLVAPNP